ncbi:MAG: LysM peptidoglycan-binding domain-containing protein [Clostridia bacterium]|nr:LysM peptidoglycan-binding domain-containing protein [Clostridia bacterium]MDD4798575.1 LysM peptidoglycan-binding domain-containing protein [Clostridia bacterium]
MQNKKKTIKRLRKVPCFILCLLLICGCAVLFNILSSESASASEEYSAQAAVSVIVDQGDSLWGLIKEYNPNYNGDMRKMVREVKELNGLGSVAIYPGDIIVIPIKA